MHKIMKGLQKDHKNLAQVLEIMELQLEKIAEGDDAALALMLDASNYIQKYPDMIHHPKENQVFDVFKHGSDEEAEALQTLRKQHEELPATTIKFQEMLDTAINGLEFISRDDLVKSIQDFIELEWEHMNLEESVIFPLINKTLEDKDWDFLEKSIKADTDPLFNDHVEETFQNLYQSINSQAA